MSIAAIKASKAFYEIYANDKTAKGLSDAEASLRKFGTRIGLIGTAMAGFAAAGLTGIGAMVKAFAGAGDNISDAMNVTGLSSDFLQTLQFGAADAGVAFDALVAAVTKSNKLLSDAAAGGKSANAALAKLGLTAADLMALSPDERFKALADAIEKIPDPAQRAAAAMAIFGKSGAKLLPALEGGMQALNEQMADLKSKGLIMSDEDRQLAVEAEGAYLSLGLAISRVSQVIAAAATPAFLAVFDVMQSVVESVVQFIDANRGLVVGLTIGLAVLGVVGGVLMAVGAAAVALTVISAGLATVWAAIGAVFAAILSPVGLIVIAIAACGAAALLAAYHLDQLFNAGAGFQMLADVAAAAMTSIQALWTAIVNGRWDLAGQLITQSLTAAFYSSILTIKEAWNSMTIWMVQVVVDAMAKLESKLPKWVQKRLGLGQRGKDVVAGMRARGEAGLADDRQRAAMAGLELGKTFAEISALDSARKAEVTKKAGEVGNIAAKIQQSSIISGSTGAISSAGAARLGWSAPANSVDEKQLEVLQGMAKVQEDVLAGIEGLEGLTAD